MLLRRILAYNISLLWSFCLWVMFHFYKHSAPLELKRLVAVRTRSVISVKLRPNLFMALGPAVLKKKNPLP